MDGQSPREATPRRDERTEQHRQRFVRARLQMVLGPMLDQGISNVSLGEGLKVFVDLADQYSGGAGTSKELLLLVKQLLYIERYAKALAPDWTIARDLYLVRNIFPDDVTTRIAETGLALPA